MRLYERKQIGGNVLRNTAIYTYNEKYADNKQHGHL